MAASEVAAGQQPNLVQAPTNVCWKSTPGAGVPPPPRLSLSAILPLSAAGSNQNQQQRQQQAREKRRVDINSDSVRTMLPRAVANARGDEQRETTTLAHRFLSIPRVRRSLAIDAASVLICVPLSVSTSAALMSLFVRRVGQDQLEWHHYMLVAVMASLVLVPIFRLAYSGHRYRRRIHRMRMASREQQRDRDQLSDYTTKSRRIEAADAARAQEYRQFACLVAKQQNIDLSRRGDQSVVVGGGGGATNISGISCHRPDISMAAYNC